MAERPSAVCPAERAGALMLSVRRFVHDPEKILGPLVETGQRVMDLGCGPGYFAIPLARLVGPQGMVVAVDIQPAMLDLLRANAERAGLLDRICPHLCSSEGIGTVEPVDFAMAFYMLHEVPDKERLLTDVRRLLKPEGRFLLVEPKGHVSGKAFARTTEIVRCAGFVPFSSPRIAFSRSVLFAKD